MVALLPWVVFFLRIYSLATDALFSIGRAVADPVGPAGDLVRRVIDGFTPQTMGFGPESPAVVDRCSSPCRCSEDLVWRAPSGAGRPQDEPGSTTSGVRPAVLAYMVLHSGILPGNWREGFLSHRRPLVAGLNDQDRRRPSQVSGLMH